MVLNLTSQLPLQAEERSTYWRPLYRNLISYTAELVRIGSGKNRFSLVMILGWCIIGNAPFEHRLMWKRALVCSRHLSFGCSKGTYRLC